MRQRTLNPGHTQATKCKGHSSKVCPHRKSFSLLANQHRRIDINRQRCCGGYAHSTYTAHPYTVSKSYLGRNRHNQNKTWSNGGRIGAQNVLLPISRRPFSPNSQTAAGLDEKDRIKSIKLLVVCTIGSRDRDYTRNCVVLLQLAGLLAWLTWSCFGERACIGIIRVVDGIGMLRSRMSSFPNR